MNVQRQARLYAHTVRRLRWEQWLYRPVRHLQRSLPVSGLATGAIDDRLAGVLADAVVSWGPGDAEQRQQRAEEILRGEFCFLNHREVLSSIDWRRRYVSHLWSYNLHYFAYGVDLAWAYRRTGNVRFATRFQQLAKSWLDETPPGSGDGWEPYALSLRIANWWYALLLFGTALDSRFVQRIIDSLAAQSNFLSSRLELHILGNHLQKNLHALVLSGLLLKGPKAVRWRNTALTRLWNELEEQVLADGGHFERSPMYHAIALGDFLELVSLLHAADLQAPPSALERLRRMLQAHTLWSRPDGSLHLFNDAANGIAPPRQWLAELGKAVLGAAITEPRGLATLPVTGYFGYFAPETAERLLIDCGAPGPTYQPGHAHCDLLSFVLDVDGQPIAVDSGTCGYGGDPFREYVRSTRAHNTVTIADQEQSEVWSTFRMARGAQVATAECHGDSDSFHFLGGYHPFYDMRVLHERRVNGTAGHWTVRDRVAGATGAPLTSYLHLHPDVRMEATEGGWVAETPRAAVRIEPFGVESTVLRVGEVQPLQGWYCPEFGKALPAPVLEMRTTAADAHTFGYSIQRR